MKSLDIANKTNQIIDFALYRRLIQKWKQFDHLDAKIEDFKLGKKPKLARLFFGEKPTKELWDPEQN